MKRFLLGFVLGGLTMLAIGRMAPSAPPLPAASVQSAAETISPEARPQPPLPTPQRESVPLAPPAAFPRRLIIPVLGVSAADILDTFAQARGTERQHEATDILGPRGTPVVATDDGVIKKQFFSKDGGITLYQFDPTEQYCYYYAHLDRYADGIREGMTVKQGDVIGYVGTTGNAPPGTPHLHFAILKLGPDKLWYQGTAINPYPILR